MTTAGTSGFGPDHLPYGVFRLAEATPRVGVRLGDRVLDAAATAPELADLLAAPTLDPLLAAGPDAWSAVRRALQARIAAGAADPGHALADVQLLLPFTVADYVDFYASEHHATALGRLFRPGSPPLLPNWKHLPVGYHGRAGTVIVSGTPVARPSGQSTPPDPGAPPGFGPSRRLDIEAEVGFVVGAGSVAGHPVPLTDFSRHVFGVCLVNDWSARDIQSWEYVPLGPFLGKSFATSVSAWVTPLAALDAAWVPPPPRDPPVLAYLDDAPLAGKPGSALDLALTVRWNGTVVSRPPFAAMYWTPAQMMAHLTVNGASLRTGDLFASGTISGESAGTAGSFVELSRGGADPVVLADGSTRTFLQDGDTVRIDATAPGQGGTVIRLGEVEGTVVAAT